MSSEFKSKKLRTTDPGFITSENSFTVGVKALTALP